MPISAGPRPSPNPARRRFAPGASGVSDRPLAVPSRTSPGRPVGFSSLTRPPGSPDQSSFFSFDSASRTRLCASRAERKRSPIPATFGFWTPISFMTSSMRGAWAR